MSKEIKRLKRYVKICIIVAIMLLIYAPVACINDTGNIFLDDSTGIDKDNEDYEDSEDIEAVGSIEGSEETDIDTEQFTEADDISDDETEIIRVYVCGAVVNEGVYEMASGGIINDALILAGGYSEDALKGKVNLAGKVQDGMKIYFPFIDDKGIDIYEYDESENSESDIVSENNSDNKININTASKNELMTLPGIGEGKADAIISYREETGRFTDVKDIMKVRGIKEGVYEQIKGRITVE